MAWVPDRLREIGNQVAGGNQPSVSVRTLLSWFGSQRRARWVMKRIREALAELQLQTEPDFNWTYLDGQIKFLPKPFEKQSEQPTKLTLEVRNGLQLVDAVVTQLVPRVDPTFRIGRLELANRPPTWVHPEADVISAVTIMLMNNFSQLPVVVHERQVKGMFSWRSLGSRLSQGQSPKIVREAMDDCTELNADASLFDAVEELKTYDCVLIRGSDGKITGIMTAFDISVTFGQLGEPFLVLGEIENHIRSLISGKFTKEELASARDVEEPNRAVEGVSDLTFGEYVRLLENPENWVRLSLKIDRAIFVKKLEEVRVIRNDIMHFDPEGIEEADLKKLRDFVSFLQRLQNLTICG
jgi:predicted transcriptional regulator